MIPLVQSRALFTQALIDVYKERVAPLGFLRSFFPSVESFTKYVSTETERTTEFVAQDVARGSEGNRNDFGKSTAKQFLPPYYHEFFDLTQLDLYDVAMGSQNPEAGAWADLVLEAAHRVGMIQDKIERAYELQCAQVLRTGIVTLKNGENINYKRKAASMVDLSAGNYWADNGVDPADSIGAAGQFIREKGKSQGGHLNIILGDLALPALINNSKITDRAKFVQYGYDKLNTPQRNSVGGTYHGTLSARTFTADVWSYNEIYQDKDGNVQKYLGSKEMIVLPDNPRFKLAFAGVPQLVEPGSVPKRGAYIIGQYKDEKATAMNIDVKSAGVAVPVAVDQIYTAQVVE